MALRGMWDSDLTKVAWFDASEVISEWFDPCAGATNYTKLVSRALASGFDTGMATLSWFDELAVMSQWWDQSAGAENLPTLTTLGLSLLFAAPGAPLSPWQSYYSALTSGNLTLVNGGVVSVPTSGTVLNGYASASFVPSLDPATLNLTGWWKADFSAAPWVGTASAGTSGSHNLTTSSGNDPIAGTAQNGHVPAKYVVADGELILHGGVLSDVFTAAAGTLVLCALVPTTSATSGSPFGDPGFLGDADGALIASFSTSGFAVGINDGAPKVVTVACSTAAYHRLYMRWNGSTVEAKVDTGSWSTLAAGNITDVTGAWILGGNPLVGYTDFSALEVMTAAYYVVDADINGIDAYLVARYAI